MKWRGKEWQREHMAEVAQGMARGAMGGVSIELLVKCWHAGGITCCVCGGRAGSAVQAAQRSIGPHSVVCRSQKAAGRQAAQRATQHAQPRPNQHQAINAGVKT